MTRNQQIEEIFRYSPEELLDITAKYVGLSVEDLTGYSRLRSISQARQVAAYLIRKYTKKSYAEIGQLLKKDHTTIVRACQNVPRLNALNELAFSIEVKLLCHTANLN
jgi:chromosomal replication initiation ATPase DnaA